MSITLATYTAILISIYKPIIFLLMIVFWAWAASNFDKDSKKHRIPRVMWNSIQLGTAAVAGLLWLIIPLFWVGFFVALLLISGSLMAYVITHNKTVEEEEDKWTFSIEDIKEAFKKQQGEDEMETASKVVLVGPAGQLMDVPRGEHPHTAAHNKLEEIVEFSLPRGVAKIDMVVNAQMGGMVAHIDGVRYRLPNLDAPVAVGLIDYLKGGASLEVEDRRKKQSGKFTVRSMSFGNTTVMLTSWGSTRELVMTLEFPMSKGERPKLDEMGLLSAQMDQLKPVLDSQQRVVIVSTLPGQGQTTAMYNFIHHHDPYINNILTMETEIQGELEGISHKQFDLKDFVPRLQNILRQEPSIILFSEIEDGQLAQMLAENADEIRFYVGMRYADTFTALKAWIKAVGDPASAAAALEAIVTPRLIRKLCPTCRVAFQPEPAALQKLNLADTVGELYRNSGQVMGKKGPEICPTCQGLGYRGQTGVYEVMVLDDEARAILAQGQIDHLRSHLRKQRMLWLQEAALARVVEGVTSIQEITRALGPDADKIVALPVFETPEEQQAKAQAKEKPAA